MAIARVYTANYDNLTFNITPGNDTSVFNAASVDDLEIRLLAFYMMVTNKAGDSNEGQFELIMYRKATGGGGTTQDTAPVNPGSPASQVIVKARDTLDGAQILLGRYPCSFRKPTKIMWEPEYAPSLLGFSNDVSIGFAFVNIPSGIHDVSATLYYQEIGE